ncbi:SR rich protein [Aphelenchoides avenae]|nr:SR rich protein [Aphelenchus avenae]
MDYFNPAFYQNVPANQVNWAQLAQQWVQYRQPEPVHMGYPGAMGPPQPTHPHHPHPVRPPFSDPYNSYGGTPFAGGPRMPPVGPVPYGHPPAGPPIGGYPPGPGINQPPRGPYWQPTPRAPVPRPVAPVRPPKVNGEEEEYKAFYDPSLTIEEEAEQPEGGAMSHWITGTADAPPGPSWNHPPPWMMPPTTASIPPLMPEIDHHVRKKLPAWILEGLEKAEKEKQKKEEKERQEKEAEEAMKARQAERVAKGLGKFDSDSDDEQDSNGAIRSSNGKESRPLDGEPVFLKSRKGRTDEPRDDDVSSEEEMTLEERKESALRAIRRIMTSVLLEASGIEMRRAARDVLDHNKSKAKPKILARSSALAALASLGGEDDEDSSSDADSSAGESSHGGRSPLPEKQVSRSPRRSEPEKRKDESVFKAPLLPIKKQAGEKPNGNDSQPTGEKQEAGHRDGHHGHSPGQSSEASVTMKTIVMDGAVEKALAQEGTTNTARANAIGRNHEAVVGNVAIGARKVRTANIEGVGIPRPTPMTIGLIGGNATAESGPTQAVATREADSLVDEVDAREAQEGTTTSTDVAEA